MQVRIVDTAFDPQAELFDFTKGRDDVGALANFVGYCRASNSGDAVENLRIDQYPGFSQSEIVRIARDIATRFDCEDILVVHRVGTIYPGEAIVLVAALSIHRSTAFEVVRVLMDYLKTDAPLWKKETGPKGARWIEPRQEDHIRRAQAEDIRV
jgi:molybdopterin synthase catalytic subunit